MTRTEHNRAARRRGELTHDRGSLRLSPAIDAQRRLNSRRAAGSRTKADPVGPSDPRHAYLKQRSYDQPGLSMPHFRCLACETRLRSTESQADSIGDLCPVCGSLLERVGDLGDIVGCRAVGPRGSTSHSGASVAGQLIADRVGEITARRELGSSRARITPAPRESLVACAADAPTGGLTADGEQHAAAGAAVDAGRPTRDDAQRLVDLLSAAHGRAVTFATLARAGVAWSAAVTCQLEFVGAPVQRVYEHGRPVGARLDTDERRRPRQITTSSLPAGYLQRLASTPRVVPAFR
jgi:hypothetical protein